MARRFPISIASSHALSNSPSLPVTTSIFRTTPRAYQLRSHFSAIRRSSSMSASSSAAAPSYEGWAEFAEKVSGEWDGYGADFMVEGKPLELPEYLVPEAYKEWEVKVFDWQTQCPTLAKEIEGDVSLFYKLIKLLPTVGCEADAVTRYTIDERNGVEAFVYQGTGSYVAVWPGEEKKGMGKIIELEYCLVGPRNKEVL